MPFTAVLHRLPRRACARADELITAVEVRPVDGPAVVPQGGHTRGAGHLQGGVGRRARASRRAWRSAAWRRRCVRLPRTEAAAGARRLASKPRSAARARREITPIDDLRSTAEYRRDVCGEPGARVLERARRERAGPLRSSRVADCREACAPRRSRCATVSASWRCTRDDARPAGAVHRRRLDAAVSCRASWTRHVHVNEPGRTEWEGFATATRAAAAGGVTTLARHAAQQHPADGDRARTRRQARRRAGTLRAWTWASWGGVVPGNAAATLRRGCTTRACSGFKCFLVPLRRGRSSRACGEADLARALAVLGRLGRRCSWRTPSRPRPLRGARTAPATRATTATCATRPRRAPRAQAVALLHRLAARARCPRARRARLVGGARSRCSSRRARARRGRSPRRRCPHYLHFAAEDVPDGRDRVQVRAAHPRAPRPRARCGGARRRARSIMVVSRPLALPARAEVARARATSWPRWGGIARRCSSGSPVVWTDCARAACRSSDSRAWMSAAPARLVGPAAAQGRDRARSRRRPGRVGSGAGVPSCAPERLCCHRHQLTPYLGPGSSGVGARHAGVRGATRLSAPRARRRAPRGQPAPPGDDRRMNEPAFTDLIDLAAERLGGAVLAGQRRVLRAQGDAGAGRPRRCGGSTSTPTAASGWTAGRRAAGARPGHDWCLVRLGPAGRRARRRRGHGVLPRQLPGAVRARGVRGRRRARPGRSSPPTHGCAWQSQILPRSPLARRLRATPFAVDGDAARHAPAVATSSRRRRRAPARARRRARPLPRASRAGAHARPGRDRARRLRAWRAATCSSATAQNLILPGRSTHMGDGWETRRRRGPGTRLDASCACGARDDPSGWSSTPTTSKGNAPGAARSSGATRPGAGAEALQSRVPAGGRCWREAAAPAARASRVGRRTPAPPRTSGSNIFPDGGVARLRCSPARVASSRNDGRRAGPAVRGRGPRGASPPALRRPRRGWRPCWLRARWRDREALLLGAADRAWQALSHGQLAGGRRASSTPGRIGAPRPT